MDPEDNLFTGGYVDSVGIMRLIAHLESTFAMKIPPPDLIPENFRTVRVMAAYLRGTDGQEPLAGVVRVSSFSHQTHATRLRSDTSASACRSILPVAVRGNASRISMR